MKLLLICVVIISSFQLAAGQVDRNGSSTNPLPAWVDKVEQQRGEANKLNTVDQNEKITHQNMSAVRPPLSKAKRAEIEEMEKDRVRITEMLTPPAIYVNRFAAFLKHKSTGLARIFPDQKCYQKKVVTIDEIEKCADFPNVPGDGSMYSFRIRSSFLNFASPDIHFINDSFITSIQKTQGIISKIGDVEIESITLNSEALKFINEYKPKNTAAEIKNEVKIFSKGINSNKLIYSNSASVVLNTTYVLRSIAFRAKKDILPIDSDDLTLVFRIVGQEKDGSVILLWRELKKEKMPLLKS